MSESAAKDGDLKENSDRRANSFRPWRLLEIHVRGFHACWASFFLAMFSSFAPAALTVTIRDSLNLDESDVALGNALTLAGTALCKIVMGSLCDAFGPKTIMIGLLLTTTLPLLSITIVNDQIGHLICRPLIGLSMGMQTVSLSWCSLLFAEEILGTSISATVGLAEAGFGCAQLLMPMFSILLSRVFEPFVAWRVALLMPGIAHLFMSLYVMLATHEPQFVSPSLVHAARCAVSWQRWTAGLKNYRTWIFAMCYGVVLGTGLSIYNIITAYYFDSFDVSFATAGVLGSLAGLVNIVYMPISGCLSDFIGRRKGMRGRLWFSMFNMNAMGLSLLFLSKAHNSLSLSILAMQLVLAFIALFAASLFSVTPFVSQRALGLVQGIIGAGANVLGAIIQELLFNKARLETHQGFFWAGILTIISSLLLLTIYYPMWGGIIWKPIEGVREVDYYLAEYSQEEIRMGLANESLKFAQEACQQKSSTVS